MNGQLVTFLLGLFVLCFLPNLLSSAPVQNVPESRKVLHQLDENAKLNVNEVSMDQEAQVQHFGEFRRADPFAEYGQFRFGKRAAQPRFADYGHLRFGRRASNGPSFKDYGHLRFGRSAQETVDEADIYKHDFDQFDDINDVE